MRPFCIDGNVEPLVLLREALQQELHLLHQGTGSSWSMSRLRRAQRRADGLTPPGGGEDRDSVLKSFLQGQTSGHHVHNAPNMKREKALLSRKLCLENRRGVHQASLADLELVGSEVITDSSDCSAPCGVGLRTQTLCLRGEERTVPEGEDKACRVRRVPCVDDWRCGLETLTVQEGARLEINCLGDVMQAMGPFSWRVSWRFARGVITSDDRLFSRLEVPGLDRVVLEPASEHHAGTYRCDVQDWAHRRGKRAYWGVRVLPQGVVDLDYPGSPAPGPQNPDRIRLFLTCTVPYMVLVGLGVSTGLAGLTVMGLYRVLVRGGGISGSQENQEMEPRRDRKTRRSDFERSGACLSEVES
ncbi:unnamed protein product [Gadus morhua 'NCC']